MVTTIDEFEEEIAWERAVLSMAVPLMPLESLGDNLDLRTNRVTVHVGSTLSFNSNTNLRDSLLPLFFGAAWKILDLCLELALSNTDIDPDQGNRWSIQRKSQLVLSHSGNLPISNMDEQIWEICGSLYANTEEIRHSLVHRRVRVDPSTYELIAVDSEGISLEAISYQEQWAFCIFAQRIAQVITEGIMSARIKTEIQSQITKLQRIHGFDIQGLNKTTPPIGIADNFPINGQIDIPYYLNRAKNTFPEATYFDLWLYLEDGRILKGELESAPEETISIDINDLPDWLNFF